jgi:predicted nucleotidyltransferase
VRVSKGDVICGLPASAARQLMRAYQLDRPTGVACGVLGLNRISAEQQMQSFEAAGYVQRSTRVRGADDAWWVTTVKGNALAQASFGRPISRATATRLLGQVIERARAYNADPARLLTVARIAVFGSYLAPDDYPLGDLDLAVSVVPREADGQRHVERSLEYAETSGRDFKAFTDMLFWPERELQMILTSRSPAISITSEDITRFTGRFQLVYEVGDDPEAIPLPQHRRQLAAAEDPTNAR